MSLPQGNHCLVRLFQVGGALLKKKQPVLCVLQAPGEAGNLPFVRHVDPCQCQGSIHCLEPLHILLKPAPLGSGVELQLDSEAVIWGQVPVLELCDKLIPWRGKGIKELDIYPGLH